MRQRRNCWSVRPPTLSASRGDGETFAVQHAAAEITLPAELDRGATLETALGPLAMMPLGLPNGGREGEVVADGGAVLYADTAPGSDTLMKPDRDAIASYTTLRDESAPETLRWRFSLPGHTVRLQRAPDESIEVRVAPSDPVAAHPSAPNADTQREDAAHANGEDEPAGDAAEAPAAEPESLPDDAIEPSDHAPATTKQSPERADDSDAEASGAIASIDPLWALDADGRQVPVDAAVAGDQLTLSVAHRDSDWAYPIVVDPRVGRGGRESRLVFSVEVDSEEVNATQAAAGPKVNVRVICGVDPTQNPTLTASRGEPRVNAFAKVPFDCHTAPMLPAATQEALAKPVLVKATLWTERRTRNLRTRLSDRRSFQYAGSTKRRYMYAPIAACTPGRHLYSYRIVVDAVYAGPATSVKPYIRLNGEETSARCNAAGQFRLAARAMPGRVFRENLERSGDLPSGTDARGFQAHHIVPKKDSGAGRAQEVAQACGLLPNGLGNGVFLRDYLLEPTQPRFNQRLYDALPNQGSDDYRLNPRFRQYHGDTKNARYFRWIHRMLRPAITNETYMQCNEYRALRRLARAKEILKQGRYLAPRDTSEVCDAPKELVTDERIQGAPLCLGPGDEYFWKEPNCPPYSYQAPGYWGWRVPFCAFPV